MVLVQILFSLLFRHDSFRHYTWAVEHQGKYYSIHTWTWFWAPQSRVNWGLTEVDRLLKTDPKDSIFISKEEFIEVYDKAHEEKPWWAGSATPCISYSGR